VYFSLYVTDTNTPAAISKSHKAIRPLLCTDFAELEFINALSLRLFRQDLTQSEVKEVIALFREDIATGSFRYVPVPSAAFQRAKDLARRHTPNLGTRSLDILHVASAMALGASQLITFDERQAKLASAVGLRVL
jgi:predicted nucleic acid-binding protein